jgi:hypothetical protein
MVDKLWRKGHGKFIDLATTLTDFELLALKPESLNFSRFVGA